MTLASGSRLGPYEIVSPLGAGGMGEVYRARDSRLGRDVAIKVLPVEFARDPARLARLEQEARATAALDHPNIVAVHDIGTHEGALFIVMELLDGASLRERLNAGPLPIRKAVGYAVQIAAGLAAAHDKGIVHRDLKPENVFVSQNGHVKILDFGLARVAIERSEASLATGVKTAEGLVMGTVGYMSPEQVRGEVADHRADIFACGTMLYEMFAGRRAFAGNSVVETMHAVLTDEPTELPADGTHAVPTALERVVRRCLEKAPAERFQSARDLAFALDTLSSVSGARPAVVDRSRRATAYVPIAAALAVGIAGGLLLRPARVPVEALTVTQLTWDAGVEASPSLSADGKWAVYTGSNAGNLDIYLVGAGGHSPINLTKDSPASDLTPTLSPDGETIAFRSERDGGGVFLMGRTGDSVRRLTNAGYNPAWSPDGKSVVVASELFTDPTSRNAPSSLSVVDVASGRMTEIVDKSEDATQPSWSPHGQRIAFWSTFKFSGRRDIYTVPAKGGTPTPVTADVALDWNPVWSPDGGTLYFLSDRGGSMNIWRVGIDEASGAVRGAPEAVSVPAQYVADLTMSAAGRLAYAALDERRPIVRVTIDRQREQVAGSPEAVTSGSRRWNGARESPDGSLLALSTIGQQEDIFVSASDGSGLRQLTNDAARDRLPAWSPDGKRVVFYSTRTGSYRIWTMNRDGSGLTQVGPDDVGWLYPAWSPDGRRLSVTDLAGESAIIDLTGSSKATVKLPAIDGGFDAFAWSPDGRRIAGTVTGGVGGVLVFSLETQKYDRLTDDGGFPSWLDDNRLLYRSGAADRLMIIDLATKRPRTLWSSAPAYLSIPTLSPGSRHAYVAARYRESDLWMATVEQK